MLIVLIGSIILGEWLGVHVSSSAYMKFGVPAIIVVGMAYLMFWIVNRPNTADFLIATEGEMKKVSWSSRKEVIGSTKVVIVTTFILAGILYGVDTLFTLIFRLLGILGV
jgi:preprotein translocase subunit SecE